jgi:predicted secreted protein
MRSVPRVPIHPARRRTLAAALAVPALLALLGWASVASVAAAAGDSDVTLTQDSSGSTLEVSVEGTASVVLMTNGGTGYAWRTLQEPDAAVIPPPADAAWPYTASQGDMPGSPVAWVWYLAPAQPGTTSLSAGLFPPGSDTPEQTYTLDIVVRDGPTSTAALAEAACGGIVGIDSDGTVTVTLASNASTGYSWKVTQEPAALLVAEPGSGDYAGPPAGSPPGAGGSQTFAWRATATGSTSLALGYVPPAATVPEKTCALTVVAGSPVERPAKPDDEGSGSGSTDGSVASTPPPTATASDEDRTPAEVGGLAFVLLALIVTVTTPILAVRRRRVH